MGRRSRDGFGVRNMWVAMKLAVSRWMAPAPSRSSRLLRGLRATLRPQQACAHPRISGARPPPDQRKLTCLATRPRPPRPRPPKSLWRGGCLSAAPTACGRWALQALTASSSPGSQRPLQIVAKVSLDWAGQASGESQRGHAHVRTEGGGGKAGAWQAGRGRQSY